MFSPAFIWRGHTFSIVEHSQALVEERAWERMGDGAHA
jgi:hypothetical protein